MSRQFRLKLDRTETFRREDFTVSPANAEAVKAVESWPGWHGGALALIGPEGSGKSHLAATWAVTAGAATIPAKGKVDLGALRGRPVLYEDADRDRTRRDEILFHLFNMAGEAGGGLLITGRTPPSGWSAALPDLRSRLNAVHVAELEAPDDAILETMLRKFFRQRNIRPTEDVFPYLLRRIERSGPKALEMVLRLDEAADAEGRAVSRALARQILETDPQTLSLFDDSAS
ncbi:MAG: chromosomal replication initiator DnaA [Caulobacteraceae bacterium]